MGFIWATKKTGTYQYTGKKNGKRKTESLRTKNYKDAKIRAKQKAREWEDTLDEEIVKMSVYEYLDDFVEDSKAHKSQGSYINEESCVRVFKEHFPVDCPMEKFTSLDAKNLIRDIANRTRPVYEGEPVKLSAARVNGYIRLFRTMWKAAVTLHIAKENVFMAVTKKREPVRLPNPLDDDEVDALFRVLYRRFPQHADIMTFYLFTGLRRKEAVELEWKNINFKTNLIRLVGKGDKERLVPLYAVPREILLRRQEENLKRPFSDAPAPGSLTEAFIRARREAKVEHKLHDLRKTFATMLAKNNVNYFFILNWLGWTDDKVARDYYIGISDEKSQRRQDKIGTHIAKKIALIGDGAAKEKAEALAQAARDRADEYRAENAVEVAEQKKAYREANRDKINAQRSQYRAKNRDKINAQKREARKRKKDAT